jgi:hypothetical protein
MERSLSGASCMASRKAVEIVAAREDVVLRVRGQFAYVLILEWLEDDDQPTGADLHEFLQEIGYPSELVTCRTGDDVRGALVAATQRVRARCEIPVVHLETHGSDPWKAPVELTCFGAGDSDGVLWTELASWLAPLNEASGMTLMVVSAACWGAALIGGLEPDHVVPFAFSIGFETKVYADRLYEAMTELYSGLRRGDAVPDCIAGAQGKLHKTEKIVLDVALRLCMAILIRGLRRARDPNPIVRRKVARRTWDRWFPRELQERDPTYAFVPERFGV